MAFLDFSGLSYFLDKLKTIFPLASQKGAANGIAELDANGKVPSSQLPSYIDDVIEGYYYNNKFYEESTHTTEIPAITGRIYVDLQTNKTYRWSGSVYAVIASDLSLGETDSTAYRGDRGKTAYDHATDAGRLTTAQTSDLYKIAVTNQGHVSSVTQAQKADITGLGVPGDVQINGTSIVANSVANIPKASNNNFGVAKIDSTYGIAIDGTSGVLKTDCATDTIKAGANAYKPITPAYQHAATFYGLAKAAGDSTQAASENAIGIYTDDAKDAIKTMFGVTPPVIMTGATGSAAGTAGYAPTPAATDNTKFLKGNGTWSDVPSELPSISSSDNGKALMVNNGSWAPVLIDTFYRQSWSSTDSVSIPLSDDNKSYIVWCAGSSAGTTGSIMDTVYGGLFFVSCGEYAIIHKGSGITCSESNDNFVITSATTIKMAVVEL